MEPKRKKKVVYNLEPNDYSKQAIKIWSSIGYRYAEGSWGNYINYRLKDNVEILITRLGGKVDEYLLASFPNLKILISATTGLNHIDNSSLKQRSIELISLRGHEDFLESITSTAELTIGLILNALRHISHASIAVQNGYWDRESYKGYQLKNKRLGIIGLGRIGKNVAKIACSFQMKIAYYDPNVNTNDFLEFRQIEELLKWSDVITIHIHSDPQNMRLIDENLIKLMKPGVVLINTSRGEIWDENAIIKYLGLGHLSVVASDVLTNEQNQHTNSPLWMNRRNPNIILTPHIGGASIDAMWECELYVQKLFLENKISGENNL